MTRFAILHPNRDRLIAFAGAVGDQAYLDLIAPMGEKAQLDTFKDVGAGSYDTVAVVEAASIDDVFAVTQNIFAPWIENKTTLAVAEGVAGLRSGSVGDLALDLDTGRLYLCQSYAWTDVTLGLWRSVRHLVLIRDAVNLMREAGVITADEAFELASVARYWRMLEAATKVAA